MHLLVEITEKYTKIISFKSLGWANKVARWAQMVDMLLERAVGKNEKLESFKLENSISNWKE